MDEINENDVNVTELENEVEKDFSAEEKEILNKENNQESDDKIEIVESTDWHKDLNLTKKELEECKVLQQTLDGFLKDKAKLELDSGVIDVLPTGIDLLDAILGGGFGVGTFSMIVGNPGTFKSSILAQVIGTSQKKYKGKLLTSYLDSENSMTTQRLFELGVKYPKLKPYSDISVEDVFKVINCHAIFKETNKVLSYPSIIAWDSIANTSTLKEKESESDDINSFIGLKARILSILMPKYVSKIKKYNISLISVNQLREKIDMGFFMKANDLRWMGDKSIPGGQAVKFNAFHLLLLAVKGDVKFEQYGFNGVKLELKCIKNKLFTPNIPITLIVDFNEGVSNFWTNYNYLAENKKIKAGAWNYLITKPELKFRTKDAYKIYSENKEFKELFDKEVQECIKINIIDKFKKVIDDLDKSVTKEDEETKVEI